MVNTEKLRSMATKMRSDAQSLLRPRETHTQKKLSQARTAEREGYHLQRAAEMVDAFCYAVDNSALHPRLLDFKPTKQAFLSATAKESKNVSNGYHGYLVDSDQYRDVSAESVMLRTITAIVSGNATEHDDSAKRRELTVALDSVRNRDIPGFFPTPQSVIETILEIAGLDDSHTVLEPSAGIGSIVEAVRGSGFAGSLTALEINPELCRILAMKGIKAQCGDFLDWNDGSYDRILMNPPFERRQAIQHVQHAFTLLADGGMVVAVMPAPQAKELSIGSIAEYPLPANAFNTKDAFRRTGVNVVLVQVRKIRAYC